MEFDKIIQMILPHYTAVVKISQYLNYQFVIDEITYKVVKVGSSTENPGAMVKDVELFLKIVK